MGSSARIYLLCASPCRMCVCVCLCAKNAKLAQREKTTTYRLVTQTRSHTHT